MNRWTTAIRNYAELSRLSNIPTIITNVLVGVALGQMIVIDYGPGEHQPKSPLILTIIASAMMLLYVAGMALNDVIDVRIDARERPERPIPSGRIGRRSALIFSMICMIGALMLMGRIGGAALGFTGALALLIVLYDLVHKRFAGSVVLMGLCRALIYVIAAASMNWPFDWTLVAPGATAILVYIVFLTLIARMETSASPGRRAWLSMLLPIPALSLYFFVFPHGNLFLPIFCGGVLLLWLTSSSMKLFETPPRMGPAIHGWLAGICLVDAYILSLLDGPIPVLICFACFGLTLLGHRFIMGT